MGTKMKGIYKGFKCTLSQMFVVKEREIEIGYPTDVKHVAHIGWDGASGNNAPTWMNEFNTGPDFATTSIGNNSLSPWSSQDLSDATRQQSGSERSNDLQCPGEANPNSIKKNKQQKLKKNKTNSSSSSSPKSSYCSSSRSSSRVSKPKSKFVDDNSKPADIQVL